MPTLLWFRHDLRLADNPALTAAVALGTVIPVFIWSPDEEGAWPPGAASKWWLHQSLHSLDADLRAAKSRLVIRAGPTLPALQQLVAETNATAVFWNRRYEPEIIARDQALKNALSHEGIKAESFNSALLHEPWAIQNKSGRPFQVFTPFWRHCLSLSDPPSPLPAPEKIPAPARWPASVALAKLALEPRFDWADGLCATWTPGEKGAQSQLKRFIDDGFDDYSEDRNRPGHSGTSRLSPHLHFGEISPRQIWHAIRRREARHSAGDDTWRHSQFLTELGWREFAHHLLHHFPHTPTEPLRSEFKKFPWRENKQWLNAWQRGQTGIPLVDAGMRELWSTGWMHNRVRMVAASFLVKNLRIPWQEGARWFWDTLVDADLAQNTLGWQWTAGCGADAAPYFRIFNPVSQAEKFDPDGDYIRRWVPELAGLSARWIHQPWNAPADELARAKVNLGGSYPEPLVSLSISREAALEAYARMRG